MASRALTRIPRRLLKLTAYAVFLGVVVFFAFTRTEVGRTQLRQQLEQRFNATFSGTLQIGQLDGNLVTNLYARDVRILDDEGRPFLAVDSVIARPRWSALISRQLSLRSVTLLEPSVHFRHRADSTWNVTRIFEREADSLQNPPSFTLANLRLQNGTIQSTNDGAPPAWITQNGLFDYTQAAVRNVSAHLTLEWNDQQRLLDIFRFSGQLPDRSLHLTQLQGQILKDDNQWIVNQARVALDSTALRFNAALEKPAERASLRATRLDLDLGQSILNFDELRALAPGLPLTGAVTAQASFDGPVSDLSIESLVVERGASRLNASGTVTGLPDTLSLDASLSESTLDAADVKAVWPDADVNAWDHLSPIDISGAAQGTIPLHYRFSTAPLRASSDFTIGAAVGRVRGSIELKRGLDAPLQFSGQIDTDSVNVGALAQLPALQSRLSGTIAFDGRGTSADRLQGTLNAAFAASTFNSHPLDTLHLTAEAQQGELSGRFRMRPTRRGSVELSGALNLNAPTPTFRLIASTQNFDLSTLPLNRAPSTQLNLTVETSGRGLDLNSLSGQAAIAFDSSTVQHGRTTRIIPPNRSTVTLTPQTAEQAYFQLEGDLAWLRAEGDVRLRPLWSLSHLWGRALADAARRAWNKPYDASPAIAARTPIVVSPESAPFPSEDMARWRAMARSDLDEAGLSAGLNLDVQLNLHRTDVLNDLLPGLAPIWTDATSRLTLRAGADELSVQGSASADSLDASRLHTDAFDASFHVNAHLNAPLTETLTGEIALHSEQATAGPLPFVEPTLTFSYENQTGHLEFEAAEGAKSGPFRLGARLDLLSDRNELTMMDVLVVAGAYRWTNVEPATLYAYTDALVIPGFALESPLTATSPPQRIEVRGTLSTRPQDTVQVTTEDVLLHPLSQLAAMKRPIGGVLNGTLALSGGLQRPAITTEMNVSWLSFGRRLLGRLDATSRYDDASSAISIDAALAPEAGTLADRPAYLPAALQRAERNRLRVRGDIQLPAPPSSRGNLLEESTFDLNVAVERADLFFFEYIFDEQIENVSGHLAGNGQIQGTFFDPLFQADLQVSEGQFDLPQFNLTYRIAGPVRVDAAGISLDDMQVTGPESGTATLRGSVLFNDYRYFSFDMAADLDEMQIINVEQSQDLPFYGTIWASGRATLTGPLSDATLRAEDARTTPNSELFIPISEEDVTDDSGFIIFADSTGQFPDLEDVTQRDNVLADRPAGEPSFLDGLELDLNVTAPEGSTIHLVFDPLLGDVVTAQGTGRVQIQRQEGEFFTYGSLEVTGGEYLFTAGEVFYRRFTIDQGTITWDGDPTNAQLDLDASYRTRASTAGLPGNIEQQGRIPVIVQLDITGRVESPRVDLSLAVDRQDRTAFVNETLDAVLNQPGLATEYATSVLLTNTFLLTTTPATSARADASTRLTSAGNQLAFTSVSQLVASQLNRYLSAALPILDVNLELQGEDPQNLDVIYGVALRLLDERLIIRGEGVYAGNEDQRQRTEGIEGEFVVEVRLSGNVSVEAFYRRSGNELLNDQTLTSTTGAGISYRTEFISWRSLLDRFLGWLIGSDDTEDEPSEPASSPTPTSSAGTKQ